LITRDGLSKSARQAEPDDVHRFLVQQVQQRFGFDTVEEEDEGGDRQPLTGHRPGTEDFVFAERFEGGGGDGSEGDGVADGIEDLDGIAFRAVWRNVVVH
jgi:hypothetical protein